MVLKHNNNTRNRAFKMRANVAEMTTYDVITPPSNMLSLEKQPANLTLLDAFVEANIGSVDALIISAELYIYGGTTRCCRVVRFRLALSIFFL